MTSKLDAQSSQNVSSSNFARLSPSNTLSDTTLIADKPVSPPKSYLQKLLLQPRRVYKTWIRCTVVFGVSMILLVARIPSEFMGQAAFFAAILAIMLPPSFAISVFIMANMTLLVGMLLGWAWGSAAMASALAVRSSSRLAQQQQTLQTLLDPSSSKSLSDQTQFHMFSGIFLDPWSSAVHGVFLFIGAFAFGAMRAYVPRMALLSIFGTIVVDVIATMGPLIPSAEYTVVKAFFIPTVFYIAAAVASLIFIFPESLSHIWLTSLQNNFIAPVQELLTLLNQSFNTVPLDHTKWQKVADDGNEIRGRLIDGTESLLGQITLIDLDVSVGRLGPEELKKICGELKGFLFRAASLHSFHTFVNDKNKTDQETKSLYHNVAFSGTSHNLLQHTKSISAASHHAYMNGYGDGDEIPLRALNTPTGGFQNLATE
ncbi:hypothetical protein CVT24_001172 [Panaeolus cyanescens]|uniref:Putative ER transporter 6TM N-terminal domain-containing protein n=1 Tax=Panaeolus cyanescens TaxID=181874 RepID=A0A409YZ11_9AGAR|nr:hypothetical protein CVT24_001172 [Panaeolus cyanescens]